MKKLIFHPVIVVYLGFQTASMLAVSFCFATYVPFLAERGMNLWQINVINSFYMGFVLLTELPTGSFADTFGRGRSMALSCFLLSIGSFVYFTADSFWIFVTAEIIVAIAHTFASGAAEAWLVDSLKARGESELRSWVFRQEYHGKSAGNIIGALSGAYLGGFDLSWPWLTTGALIFLVGIFALRIKDATIDKHESENELKFENEKRFHSENQINLQNESSHRHQSSLKSLSQSTLVCQIKAAWQHGIRSPDLLFAMSFGACLAFAVQALNMQWSLLFKDEFGFTSLHLGFIYVAIAVSMALGARFSKLVNRSLSDKLALVLPQTLTATAIIFCSLVRSLPAALGAFLIHEFGRGMRGPIHQDFLNNRIPSGIRATALSLDSMFSKFGALSGLLLSGLIAEQLSIRTTWLLSGLGLMLAVAIFFLIIKREKAMKKLALS